MSAVATETLTGTPLTADDVTVNTIGVVPLSPSVAAVHPIDTIGASSSSMIVPVAVAVPMVALVGFERLAVNVSLFSCSVSPTTGTANVALVEPAGIATVLVVAE